MKLWVHIHEYLTDTWIVAPWTVFSTVSPCKVASPHCTVLCQQLYAEHDIPPVHFFPPCLFTPCARSVLQQRHHTAPHTCVILRPRGPTLPCSPVPAPTAQRQLRASIAFPAPGCPLVMYPTCHRAALPQQQGRTGAPSGQQHRRCWGWKKVKKNGKREKEINEGRVPCGYCHVPICFKSHVLRFFWTGNGD